MKRIYLCAALLLFGAAACAPAPTDNANSNANVSNTNAANSNMMSASWTNDDVISNEKKAWDAIKSKDYAAFDAMLETNFIDVTQAGVLDKAGTVAEVKTFDLTDVTLSDFKVIKLDNDAAVVVYTVALKGSVNGKPIPANAPSERHATAKVWRGGKWLAVYHQETPSIPIPPPVAAGAAANSNGANAKNANTPDAVKNANAVGAKNTNATTATAGPAVLTPTADVEANEKMVWDAFDKKNINGFEAVLAEDSLEVEDDGVYTKAASVDMIRKMLDTTSFKSTLSDFKTVTLDEDAKVVTYVAKSNSKGFPPSGVRHSTVWVNRGGKWMVAYHQGTNVVKQSANPTTK
jgi:hypothetical protein